MNYIYSDCSTTYKLLLQCQQIDTRVTAQNMAVRVTIVDMKDKFSFLLFNYIWCTTHKVLILDALFYYLYLI